VYGHTVPVGRLAANRTDRHLAADRLRIGLSSWRAHAETTPTGIFIMISECLGPDQIHLALSGSFEKAIRKLSISIQANPPMTEAVEALLTSPGESLLLPTDHIGLPHLRLSGLTRPQLAIGFSRQGIPYQGHRLHIILFLVSPEEDAADHIKLLQRLSAVVPQIEKRLLQAGSARDVIAILKQGEKQSLHPSYRNLSQAQVAFELGTDLDSGLSDIQATERLTLHGPNLLNKPLRPHWYIKVIRNFFSFFAILLWTAGLLCYAPGVDMPQLGTAILVVVVINGIFAILQEQRSDRAVESLQKLFTHQCRVVRGGRTRQIDAVELAPGDLLVLEEGDFVPADARIVEAAELEVDNASLTGESESAKRYKSDKPVLLEGNFLWIELPNVLFAGSVVVRGTARAVVFGTGMNTEIGKIANLTQAIATEPSPLQKQLHGTVFAIATLAATLSLAFLLLGWLGAGLNFLQAFVFCIGIFVANVPEGLLPTVTLSLAMGVTRMAKRQAIVKNLSSVETLGCTTVICSDKTGTLTQNLVMVNRFWADGRIYDVTGDGYAPYGQFRIQGQPVEPARLTENPSCARLMACAHICNNAVLENKKGRWGIVGDPTEGALIVLARKAGFRGTCQRLHINPFESVRKRMSVLVKPDLAESETILYLKGALVETLALCNRIQRDGHIRPINDGDRQEILKASDDLARRGLRILAFAWRDQDSMQNLVDYSVENAEKQLVFIGFTASLDPLRPTVPESVRACHRAGIRLMMITGDYPLTAESIGREAGIGNPESGALTVVNGARLTEMDDDALKVILRDGETIFARVAPEQKLRIVTVLRELGEVVAVTGDGVNDGPALRRADIGIAMGLRGTDVAKEAAHMILSDDNFSSIVAAIEEGRAIFENIKRFVAYILNSNPQEMYPYILWILFPQMPLSMTIMGVLAVDIGTDLIPAMGLGIERPEKGIMDRPPRPRREKLLSMTFILQSYFVQGGILALACYLNYFFAGWYMGWWSPAGGSMPASPPGLDMSQATQAYLMSLTAYFFPTVTTQIANVMCKRSWQTSLFSIQFLNPQHRLAILERIRTWCPDTLPVFVQPMLQRIAALLSRFFHRHPVLLNLVSNPLIDAGIIFELAICVLLFYTGLSQLYWFAPVPWPIYLSAFHGTVLLIAFEETKKYFRRKGHPLTFLG